MGYKVGMQLNDHWLSQIGRIWRKSERVLVMVSVLGYRPEFLGTGRLSFISSLSDFRGPDPWIPLSLRCSELDLIEVLHFPVVNERAVDHPSPAAVVRKREVGTEGPW